MWGNSVIMNILFNPVYTGTVVYERTACNAKTNYKTIKQNPKGWTAQIAQHDACVIIEPKLEKTSIYAGLRGIA